jgi:large subunit ribosomal protein L11
MLKKFVGKEIIKILKLYVPAQNPTGNSMLNPILGQAGLNSAEFIKKFTEISKNFKQNVVLKVQIYVFSDKTFEIIVGLPSLSYILNEEMLKYSGLKFLLDDNIIFGSKISLSNVYKIAFLLQKIQFFEKIDLILIVRLLFGTLKSMHCIIINDLIIK